MTDEEIASNLSEAQRNADAASVLLEQASNPRHSGKHRRDWRRRARKH